MSELFSEFSEYYANLARDQAKDSEVRAQIFTIAAMIIPFLEDMIEALESDTSETSFEGKIHTACKRARELMVITPESDDYIEETIFEVALLDNENRDIAIALGNFKFHLEKFIEINNALRNSLQQ